MPEDQTPQLPSGDFSILSSLSQSLAFHSSPESFISSRAQAAAPRRAEQIANEEVTCSSKIIRARILGRNVAVVSSHQICEDIMKAGSGELQSSVTAAEKDQTISETTFTARSAYFQLMSDFFPAPNILLLDRPEHHSKRTSWEDQLSFLPADTSQTVRQMADDHFSSWNHGDSIDIYQSMKDFS